MEEPVRGHYKCDSATFKEIQKKYRKLHPPEFPPARITNYTTAVGVCEKCGSTKSRTGFLRLFGKVKCDNYKCK